AVLLRVGIDLVGVVDEEVPEGLVRPDVVAVRPPLRVRERVVLDGPAQPIARATVVPGVELAQIFAVPKRLPSLADERTDADVPVPDLRMVALEHERAAARVRKRLVAAGVLRHRAGRRLRLMD